MKHWVVNKGERSTPASTAIDLHYANLKLRDHWSFQRFDALCGMIRCAQVELASTIGMTHDRLKGAHTIFYQAECILLTLMESFLLKGMKVDAIDEPILPMHLLARSEAAAQKTQGETPQ